MRNITLGVLILVCMMLEGCTTTESVCDDLAAEGGGEWLTIDGVDYVIGCKRADAMVSCDSADAILLDGPGRILERDGVKYAMCKKP